MKYVILFLVYFLILGCSFTKKNGESQTAIDKKALTPNRVQNNIIAAIRLGDNKKLEILINSSDPSDIDFSNMQTTPLGAAYEENNAEATKILIEKGYNPFELGNVLEKYSNDLFEHRIRCFLNANHGSQELEFNESGYTLFASQEKILNKIRALVSEKNYSRAAKEASERHVDLGIMEYIFILDTHKNWDLEDDQMTNGFYPLGYGVRDQNTFEFLSNLKIHTSKASQIQQLLQLEYMSLFMFSFADISYFSYLYHHPNLGNQLFKIGNTGLFLSPNYIFQLAKIQGLRKMPGNRGTDHKIDQVMNELNIIPKNFSFIYIKGGSVKTFPLYRAMDDGKRDDEVFQIVLAYVASNSYEKFKVDTGFLVKDEEYTSEWLDDFFKRTDAMIPFQCEEKTLDSSLFGCKTVDVDGHSADDSRFQNRSTL